MHLNISEQIKYMKQMKPTPIIYSRILLNLPYYAEASDEFVEPTSMA